MMIRSYTDVGVSFGFHDAAIAAIRDDQIVYGSHSERYSRYKNDPWLHAIQMDELNEISNGMIGNLTYYERPWLKAIRQYLIGQKRPRWGVHEHLRLLSRPYVLPTNRHVGHHESHAAAGFYTSPWTEAAIIVVDAIGEFDTVSIWEGRGASLKKVWSQRYPHSLGLLYSAFTKRVGLKPNEHEYILMGMAPYGDREKAFNLIANDFLNGSTGEGFRLLQNVHRGIGGYHPEISHEDLAAGIQGLTEQILINLFRFARKLTGMNAVCYQGGVALNCTANTKILQDGAFDYYWIMPNPGDAGASLGAALAKKRDFVEFKSPSIGTNIKCSWSSTKIVNYILKYGLAGLAQGKAEFGPRAFGNRSLLADPRVPAMQNRVNQIKNREKFRPFAPMVLAQYADKYFETYGADHRYMQYAVQCKRPEEIPAVVHVDGSSRIQTVKPSDGYIYDVLAEWHRLTDCPVLLNTSLNIRGEPLVNTRYDASKFEEKHKVKVF